MDIVKQEYSVNKEEVKKKISSQTQIKNIPQVHTYLYSSKQPEFNMAYNDGICHLRNKTLQT